MKELIPAFLILLEEFIMVRKTETRKYTIKDLLEAVLFAISLNIWTTFKIHAVEYSVLYVYSEE